MCIGQLYGLRENLYKVLAGVTILWCACATKRRMKSWRLKLKVSQRPSLTILHKTSVIESMPELPRERFRSSLEQHDSPDD